MNPSFWFYFSYLAISLLLTVWVAQTLHKNGRIFLVDVFGGNEPMARALNHLLVVAFYVINLGFIGANLRNYEQMANTPDFLLIMVGKVGGFLLMLGAVLLVILFILSKIGKHAAKAP